MMVDLDILITSRVKRKVVVFFCDLSCYQNAYARLGEIG
jgi:hypothetical protein